VADLVGAGFAQTGRNVGAAVGQTPLWTLEGLRARLFTHLFRDLVYAQIWEDPVVDLEALALRPGEHIVTIASGGCNALSYLTADPGRITAVDLNAAHVALNRLKIAAVRHLPDHESLRTFLVGANDSENVAIYRQQLRRMLDPVSAAYWDGRDGLARPRIERFANGFYRHGLLGRCIALGHALARLHGRDPRRMLTARTREEQAAIFERELRPLFRAPLIRFFARRRASLYGLGIPPAQYEALLTSDRSGRGMAGVLEQRLEKLACGHDLSDNYFAWQAFGRGYGPGAHASVPPFLMREHYEAVRDRAHRIDVRQVNVIDHLASLPARSVDAFNFLDAQDWMSDAVLTRLWTEVTRTARPGARVLFRTAGEETILPGRVPDAILSRWESDPARNADFTRRDRSAIYGGVHLYRLKGEAP
jgi:S-adenosylmethionine-diacylglycerol 3-amino-3-carboxypropyl transferase